MKIQRGLIIALVAFIVCYLIALGMAVQPTQLEANYSNPQELRTLPTLPTAF